MIAEIIGKIAEQFSEDEYDYRPRPSLAGPERCIRQMVYHAIGIERSPFPGRTLLVFDDGNWHEQLTLDWVRKSALQVHSEQMAVSISFPGYDMVLSGKIDAIVTDILGRDRLLEHKAINHFTFQRFAGGQLPLDYITQTCLYLRGLQEVNPDLKEALLLIKNKNTAAYLEINIKYDGASDVATVIGMIDSNGEEKTLNIPIDNICRDAFEKFKAVQDYADKKTLPKRQYFIDDWHCAYCGWANKCWENYKDEFDKFTEDAALSEDIKTMVQYYRELGAQKSDIEKEYKDLSDKLKMEMKKLGVRQGRIGEYLLKLALVETNRIDASLLSEAEKEKATIKSFYERLSVSSPKKKEVGKNG